MSDPTSPKLPRRDYFLLPLVALLTLIVMIGSTEFVAERKFNEMDDDTCRLSGTGKHKPNCSVTLKAMEGPTYLESYNTCGYRSLAACGTKPSGHIRISVMGSSFALGDNVSYEKSFIGVTERDLNAACPRPVEFQNLSAIEQQPLALYRRTDEALALKPDVLLLTFSPTDADVNYTDQEIADRDNPVPVEKHKPRPKVSLIKRLSLLKIAPATLLASRHFLFQNQAKYLRLYMNTGDQADFLRQPFTPIWQRRIDQLDIVIGAIADKAHAQGVPVVFAPGLQRAEIGFMSESTLPPGIDPYAFEREMTRIAAKHGLINIDPDPYFSHIPNSSNLFYAIDGHLDSNGNGIYAQALTDGLLQAGLAPFQGCKKPSQP